LRSLAKDRGFQLVYLSDSVETRHTGGAVGEFTVDEALKKLLSGTGLDYKYVDDRTISIVPHGNTSNLSTLEEEARRSRRGEDHLRLAQGSPNTSSSSSDSDSETDQSSQTVDQKRNADRDSAKRLREQTAAESYQANTPEVLIVGSKVMNVD